MTKQEQIEEMAKIIDEIAEPVYRVRIYKNK